jgi:MFS family permease
VTPRPTPPPVFALTIVPFAAAVGYVSIAAPYWLATRGVSLAEMGAISGTAFAPHALKVFWAPLVDLGERRRTWFVGMTLLTALALLGLALLPRPEHNLAAFTALAFAANLAGTTAAAAADGLMAATTAAGARGRAAGWRMAGNVGGTGVLGALPLWLGSRTSVAVGGAVLALLVAASAAAALLVHEARHPGAAGEGGRASGAWARLAAVWRDLSATLLSREGWTGLVICAVPVGAGALTNLFSAMAPDYGAGEDLVALVNGLWGGVIGAAGSFVGGWLADRMNRRLAYALSGAVSAGCALAMLAGPMTPATFVWGTMAYNFANGIAFAALAAFILEMVGPGAAAATKYTAFIAVANLASSYVVWLDGLASAVRGAGARGSLLADALLTFAGVAVLLVMVRFTRRALAAR